MRIRVQIGEVEGAHLTGSERVRLEREIERRLSRLMQGRRSGPPGIFGTAADTAARQIHSQIESNLGGDSH